MKKMYFAFVLMICMLMIPTKTLAAGSVSVIIDGKNVSFTNETGYPFINANNIIMVPLKATMEAAGATVGYDTEKSTAIVIITTHRIEIPIGTSIFYDNNAEIPNEAESAIINNIVYMPIHAVLQVSGYTVAWDIATSTMSANTPKKNESEYVPYSTSSLETLLNNIVKGNVVCINGQYYATAEYASSFNELHYEPIENVNTSLYPLPKKSDVLAINDSSWISGMNFDKVIIHEAQWSGSKQNVEQADIPGYIYAYGFYETGVMGTNIIYAVDEMTSEFMNLQTGEGTFNGIRMKKDNGMLFFKIEDLKAKNLYE